MTFEKVEHHLNLGIYCAKSKMAQIFADDFINLKELVFIVDQLEWVDL